MFREFIEVDNYLPRIFTAVIQKQYRNELIF